MSVISPRRAVPAINDAPISSETPDWTREEPRRLWDPSRRLIQSIRSYQHWQKQSGPLAGVMRRLAVAQHRFWSVVTATDIPVTCQLGGGLLMVHPTGVVIHPEAVIGPNCLLMQQVTLVHGVRLEGHVDVGAGAKIVRPVTIGAHAVIGANAVVLEDVPPGATAVGVPARIIPAKKSGGD